MMFNFKKAFSKKNFLEKYPYFIIAIVLFISDVATKIAINITMPLHGPHTPKMAIIHPFLYFRHIKNKGIAFGIFNNVPEDMQLIKFIALLIIALILMAAIVNMILTIKKEYRLSLISLTLILGGALGNVRDRVILQEVTDFIDMGFTTTPVNVLWFHFYEGLRFPWIFNLADTWITCGIVLALIAFFIFNEDVADELEDKENGGYEEEKNEEIKE